MLKLWRDARTSGPRRALGVRLQARRTTLTSGWTARRRAAGAERLIWTTMAALDCQDLASEALISVILPTRNRVSELRGAIESVRRQSYRHWELVVIDDGSDDGTAPYLASLEDERIRTLRIDSAGLSAARNAGLGAARGEIIAYLDDDNRMHSGWLRAVAWAMARSPQHPLLYGARIVEAADPRGATQRYTLCFERFSPRRLRVRNFIDVSTIAHRAGLVEAHFDERLHMFADWDLLLRLTHHHPPLELPVVACLYTTAAEGRISDSAQPGHELPLIWERVHGPRGARPSRARADPLREREAGRPGPRLPPGRREADADPTGDPPALTQKPPGATGGVNPDVYLPRPRDS